LCRPLGSLVSRLELLGYTLEAAKAEYASAAIQYQEDHATEGDSLECGKPGLISFEAFMNFVCQHAVASLNDEVPPHVEDAGRNDPRGRFVDEPDAQRLPRSEDWDLATSYSERSHFGNLLGFLAPYSALRVLAENPANLELDVVWDCGAFVHAGWAKNEEFVAGARRVDTFLIATEGTSDTNILKRAISVLLPDVEDFFKFIDPKAHPFSGTGNLAKFAEGLVRIDVQNRIVFLFDNDAEGISGLRLLQGFELPSNMGVLVLPDLEAFRSFPAIGPEGISSVDINGRAAAIECNLDLRLQGFSRPPMVRWSNYKKDSDTYQGALEFKDTYSKAFFAASDESIANGSYEANKLQVVLEALIQKCVELAAAVRVPLLVARRT